jgi:hypothetical protein
MKITIVGAGTWIRPLQRVMRGLARPAHRSPHRGRSEAGLRRREIAVERPVSVHSRADRVHSQVPRTSDAVGGWLELVVEEDGAATAFTWRGTSGRGEALTGSTPHWPRSHSDDGVCGPPRNGGPVNNTPNGTQA